MLKEERKEYWEDKAQRMGLSRLMGYFAWHIWQGTADTTFLNSIKKEVKETKKAELLRTKKIIESMKIDIIGSCAYQGADLPKTWLKKEVPIMQERNRTLEELKNKIENQKVVV